MGKLTFLHAACASAPLLIRKPVDYTSTLVRRPYACQELGRQLLAPRRKSSTDTLPRSTNQKEGPDVRPWWWVYREIDAVCVCVCVHATSSSETSEIRGLASRLLSILSHSSPLMVLRLVE